jgi:two-component system chemotaxis response regulator CheB
VSTPSHKIKVLVVDDSAVSRTFLAHTLQSDPGIEVIACAHGGAEAIAALARQKPDVVTMDIHMPDMDGFEATRQIMETVPVPIVIVSASYDAVDVEKAFRAMEAGAVAMVEKPCGSEHPKHHDAVAKLIGTVKTMAEVRVVRRWTRNRMATRGAATAPLVSVKDTVRLVLIGASTGGPPVLQTLLSGLPKPFPVPVVIVQHISAGFVQGLVDWLNATTGMPVHLARHGDVAQSGHAYLAPDGRHTHVELNGRMVCCTDPAEHGLRPSVSFLFRSAAHVFGAQAVGVLLTGMGTDGAVELKLMRDRGAITFAQDEESSIVHGMPGEAIRLGAATHVGSPERLAGMIHSLVTRATRKLPTPAP